jgi:hypothetical protein
MNIGLARGNHKFIVWSYLPGMLSANISMLFVNANSVLG